MNAKILLAAPTSEHKDYCMKQWIEWITTDFSDIKYDILIVDNSKDSNYCKKIQEELGEKGEVMHLPYKKDRSIIHTIAESNEMIRKYFLEGNYEFLFFNESDVFVPKNMLNLLLWENKQVIGAPYFIGHLHHSKIMSQVIIPAGSSRDIAPKTLKKAFIDFNGVVSPAVNIGLGALLIHRGVLDIVDFKVDDENNPYNSHSDSHFHEKVKKAGIQVFQINKRMAYHMNGNWNKVYNQISSENEQ